MAELRPYPFPALVRRALRELDERGAIFDLPIAKGFYGSPAHDLAAAGHDVRHRPQFRVGWLLQQHPVSHGRQRGTLVFALVQAPGPPRTYQPACRDNLEMIAVLGSHPPQRQEPLRIEHPGLLPPIG